MTKTFTCDDKHTLIDYVYGEIDAVHRIVVEQHLAACEPCASEVRALGGVRSELGLWLPPDAELGFQIVRKAEAPAGQVLRPAQWWHTVPAWAQAAAAVLVLAAGLGLANLQIRSGPEGFSVSTGWMAPAPAAVATPAAVPDDAWKTALVSLEQELRGEIRAARDQQDAAPMAAAAPASDEATLRRVQQLIAASEGRQQRELALRLTQFTRDVETQRRADLMRITSSFGDVEGRMLRQRQMLNNVIRVSGSPQQ